MQRFLAWFLRHFGLIIMMMLFWLGFSSTFSWSVLVTGLVLSIIIKFIADYIFEDAYRYYIDLYFFLGFIHYLKNLSVEIFKNAFQLLPIILWGKDQPIIFNVHLDTTDPVIITLVANAITLTPGTVTLEVGEEQVLSVLSITDDGQEGSILADQIRMRFQAPFNRVLYRMED